MLLLEGIPELGCPRAVAGCECAADPVKVQQNARCNRSPVREEGVVEVEQNDPGLLG